jgi:uncharacterized protein (TIGR03437 family)
LLAKRIDSADDEHNPGRTAQSISLDSAKRLAAVTTQLSLGEWRPIGPWIYAGKAFDVAVSPIDPNTVYAAFGVGGGLWKTSDGGQTWLQLTDRSDLTATACVSVHPNLPDVVVACIGGPGDPSARRGLMYSTDAGRHFDFIGPSDGLSTSFYRAVFNPNDPNIIYAASEKGVYLTKDRGATWKLVLTFPGTNADGYDTMPDLLMKPDQPSVLIAAQINLGVSRTTDGGATWTRVDQAMDASTQTSILAWSPSDPNTVYCERNNTDGQHMVTYASKDAGATWSQAANLAFYHQDRYDMALAVDPTNPARVMLANGNFGISADGLKTYNYVFGKVINCCASPHPDHLRVVFSPSNPTIVYDANDAGIWRSTDAGATWSRFDAGVNTNISFGFDVDTSSGNIYLSSGDYSAFQYTPTAGWYDSPSFGSEWTKFYVDPNDSTTIWNAGFNGLSVSHDSGKTWKNVDPDPPAGGVKRPYRTVLRFHPTQRGTLFFLEYAKVWVSHDGGNTWTDIGLRTSGQFYDMIFDLARPGAAYISEDGGIFASTDGGTTWTENKSSVWGLPNYPWYMAPVPGVAGQFYMADAYGGMYLISNGGQRSQSLPTAPFSPLTVNGIHDMATDPAHPERLYVGTAAGLFFSPDYGQSWQRLGRNLPAANVWQISVKENTIYAGTSQAIWQFSSDVSWQPQPPANLAATATSTSSITLSWTPGSNSTGVRIFRNGVQAYVGLERSYSDLGLAPATNYCYTALDSNASGEGPLSSQVCVTTPAINSGPASVAVSTTSLQFAYTLGQALPGGLPVQIANGGFGATSWSASSNVPWLTLGPASGTLPATLAVGLNSVAKSLNLGTYTGTVSITEPGIPSQPIAVTLKINPAVNVGASSITFQAPVGGNAPAAQSLTVSLRGATTFTANASEQSCNALNWLAISPAGNVTVNGSTTNIAVSVNQSGIAVGTACNGTITLTAGGTTQTVGVTMVVAAQVIYTSLGPNLGFSSNGWCVSGANNSDCGPDVTRWIAGSFTPSATFALYGIGLPIANISGTNGALVVLCNSTGGAPGTTVLEQWAVSNLPKGNPSITSVTSKLNPTLQAGQTYWLVAEGLANDSMDYWFTNNLSLGGGMTNINGAGWQTLGGDGGQTQLAFQVLGSPAGSPAPSVNAGGIVNAAIFNSTISPGSIVSLFGANLASGTVSAAVSPLPTMLSGTQVLVNGTPAPLFYVSPTQINLQLPNGISGNATMMVTSGGASSVSTTVAVSALSPAIFMAGGTQGAILNQDYSANSAANPAAAGSVIQIFATGLGATSPPLATGQAGATSPPFNTTVNTVTATINGTSAPVAFSAAAPGFVGLFQINVTVPPDTPSGSAVPLQLQVAGQSSNTVTVAVKKTSAIDQ